MLNFSTGDQLQLPVCLELLAAPQSMVAVFRLVNGMRSSHRPTYGPTSAPCPLLSSGVLQSADVCCVKTTIFWTEVSIEPFSSASAEVWCYINCLIIIIYYGAISLVIITENGSGNWGVAAFNHYVIMGLNINLVVEIVCPMQPVAITTVIIAQSCMTISVM